MSTKHAIVSSIAYFGQNNQPMPYLLTLLLLGSIPAVWASTSTLPNIMDMTVAKDTTYLARAQQHEAQGEHVQAIDAYERAKVQAIREQNDPAVVYILNRLASRYATEPDTQEKASAYLDSAKTILTGKLYENDTLQALTWSTQAELAEARWELDQALEFYQKALKRKRAVYGENHPNVARALEHIGDVYLYSLQNPHEAEQYYQQALTIRELLDDQSRLLVNDYYSLAYANRLRGDYEAALAFGFRVLEGYENMPNGSAYDHNLIATGDLLGTIYLETDSLERALLYNKEAIKRAKSARFTDMSTLYQHRAEYHFQAERYDSTIHYARLAIANQSEPFSLANSYQFLANGYRGKGQLGQALLTYRKSQVLKESIFDSHHSQLATLYTDMGQAFAVHQHVDSARHYYQKALASAKISQPDTRADTDLSIQAGDDLGAIEEVSIAMSSLLVGQYERTKDTQYLTEALPYFRLFDRFMDLSRREFSTERAKLLYSATHKAIYERAIASCYRLYQTAPSDSLLQDVLHFMEKNKALVLLESIHQAERYQRVLPDSLARQDQSLRAQLAYIQSELIFAQQQEDASATLSDWRQKKAEVLRTMERLDQHIRIQYPNYYEATYRDLTVRLDSLQRQVTAQHPLVSYFWGDSAVYALLITTDTVKIHRVDAVDTLRETIRRYREVLVNDAVYNPSYANFQQFQRSAHRLYRWLLEPLLTHGTVHHLTLVPDGDLTTIPFESLITSLIDTEENRIRYGKLPYLIRAYGISYEFSLSLASQQRTLAAPDEDAQQVVAFGIKNFDELSEDRHYPALGGAEREVQYVQEKFPQARIFLNEEATEAQFKQQAPQADVLHIATHGRANLDNPFTSQFIFHPEGPEDGILHLYELYDLPLKARLLLLSACESGVGKHYVGEGNFSLARSFVYAGCQSVVMTLWQINDLFTEQLIKGTYDRLAKQQTIGEAVRNTKLAIIEKGTYAHPRCWAGMVPLGNTSIEFPEPSTHDYTFVILVIAGLGLIYFIRRLVLRHSSFNLGQRRHFVQK